MQYASHPLLHVSYVNIAALPSTHSLIAMRTTARTAPFIPGASPPLVMTPILLFLPSRGGGTGLLGSVGAICWGRLLLHSIKWCLSEQCWKASAIRKVRGYCWYFSSSLNSVWEEEKSSQVQLSCIIKWVDQESKLPRAWSPTTIRKALEVIAYRESCFAKAHDGNWAIKRHSGHATIFIISPGHTLTVRIILMTLLHGQNNYSLAKQRMASTCS